MEACNDTLLDAQREAAAIIAKMSAMKEKWAEARQVVALRDKRIDKELAVLVVEGLENKLSATAAEWRAKADKRYTEAIKKIMRETSTAECIIREWYILEKQFEHCQAIQNNERKRIGLI
jgi:hypothetical protein